MLDILDSTNLGTSKNWQSLFAPETIAVIGASDVVGSWGHGISWRLISAGRRTIYLVNPNIPKIMGRSTYRSVLDVPGPVDLAIIVVPAAKVAGVLRECGQKGVKAAIIISGGFSETGEAGSQLEAEIVKIAREGGINFVGPNTMGHANTHAGLSTLAWVKELIPGPVALVAQSGNCGSRILHHGMALGIGFSKFVCAGNEADLHLEDYLAYLSHDDDTAIIATYIEGLREGRRFLRLAREITTRKPIVALKSGGTEGSAKAARSHTGALAGSEAVYAAAFKQAGVIRVDDDDELIDVLLALLHQPLPRGNRVGILTIGGGLGVVSTEACEREGLAVVPLSPRTMEKLNTLLPPRWSHSNPIDLVGISSAADNHIIIESIWVLLEDENIDALILQAPVAFGSGLLDALFHFDAERMKAFQDRQRRNLELIRQRTREHGKPVLIVMPVNDPETSAYLLKERIPTYPNPQRAARVLRQLTWYKRYLDTVSEAVDLTNCDKCA